jgi:hypothetical protein
LCGDKPADLPVKAPTKFETRRQSQDSEGARRNDTPGLLLAADEVIE